MSATASVRRLLLPLMGLMAAVFFPASAPSSHEARPAYLQIDEIEPGRSQFLWRTPVLSGMPLPVGLQFPEDVRQLTVPSRQELPDSIVERGVIGGTGAVTGEAHHLSRSSGNGYGRPRSGAAARR